MGYFLCILWHIFQLHGTPLMKPAPVWIESCSALTASSSRFSHYAAEQISISWRQRRAAPPSLQQRWLSFPLPLPVWYRVGLGSVLGFVNPCLKLRTCLKMYMVEWKLKVFAQKPVLICTFSVPCGQVPRTPANITHCTRSWERDIQVSFWSGDSCGCQYVSIFVIYAPCCVYYIGCPWRPEKYIKMGKPKGGLCYPKAHIA